MARLSRQAGTTSQIIQLVIKSTASSPTGLPLPALVFGSSGLTCYYKRDTASADAVVSLVSCVLGTYTSGGFLAVDGTNMTGVYEFHIPNAALASGADNVVFCFQGAANMAPYFLEIELTAVNNQSAAFGLSLAKTTNITGFNDIAATAIVSSGAITTSGGAVSTVTTVTNQLTAAAIATGVFQDTTAGDFTVAGSIGKGLFVSGAAPGASGGFQINGANLGAVSYSGGITVNITGNLSGSVGSVTGSVGSVAGAVASVTGNVGGSVASVTGAVGSVTGNVGGSVASVTAGVTISLTQTLSAARALDAIADTSYTLNDAFQAAVASIAAQIDASSGTQAIYKTASTGTTLRTKTLTLVSPPSTVPDKAV